MGQLWDNGCIDTINKCLFNIKDNTRTTLLKYIWALSDQNINDQVEFLEDGTLVVPSSVNVCCACWNIYASWSGSNNNRLLDKNKITIKMSTHL